MLNQGVRDSVTQAVYGPKGEVTEPHRHWQMELEKSKKDLLDFHKQAKEAVDRYLDGTKDGDAVERWMRPRRLALFHSNIETLESTLYARIPKAEADRRFFDPGDDVARVAAEMMTRVVNNDLNDPEDNSRDILKSVLHDKLVSGLGIARFQYKPTFAANPEYDEAAPVPGIEKEIKTDEKCEPIYTYWEDVLWSACRTWTECRWMAFRSYMVKELVEERFGEEIANSIPYVRKGNEANGAYDPTDIVRIVPEAEIWEIWDREKQNTVWFVNGYHKLLDERNDMLEIPGFLPTPKPFASNTTTTRFIPKPDFSIHQSLYDEIDELETRIAYLTRAAKAVGVYDAANKSLERVLSESTENEMIPVENWAMFSQNGGLNGAVDWIPIESITRALEICVAQQNLRIQQLFQVSGMSDIIRGQSSGSAATATEQKIKAQFATGRIQSIQESFADYVTDLVNIKVAIIRKHYDPQRIIELSNIMATPDAHLAEQAVALIKNTDQFNIRVAIQSESMAQQNSEAVKEERAAMLQAIAQFLGMAQPYMQTMPGSTPFLLRLLQFGIAGFKGAKQMEGVLDSAIDNISQELTQRAQQPPPPSPEQQKIQGQMQIEQMKAQSEMQGRQQDAQIEGQKMQAEMQMDQQTFMLEMQKMKAEIQMDREKHELEMRKLEAQIQAQSVQAAIKASSDARQAEIKEDTAHTQASIKADSAQQQADIKVAQAKAMPKRPAGGTP